MKKLIILYSILTQSVFAQVDSVTLFDCYQILETNFPKIAEKNHLHQVSELTDQILKTSYYPSITLNGKATYQSDVTAIDVDLSNMGVSLDIPSASKDQYKVSVDVNQVIYDGGRIKAARELEQKSRAVNLQSVDVEMHQYKELINTIYFNVLSLQKRKELLAIMLDDLNGRRKSLAAAVDHGVILRSELLAFDAEILKVEQQIDQISLFIGANKNSLWKFLDIKGSDNSHFLYPKVDTDLNLAIARPEYDVFNLTKDKIEANKELASKERMPSVYAFGQVGYGRPGLNMMSDEFESYYIVGAGLSWNVWDWKQQNKKQQILSIQSSVVDMNRQVFDRQLSVRMNTVQAEIETYKNALIKDNEIIELREAITISSKARLDNGTITSTDYISDLNAEIRAKLNYENHKIELTKSKINFLYLKGNL